MSSKLQEVAYSMSLTISTICENSAGGLNVLGEWGLSMLLECDGLKILYDTGQGKTLINNALAMGFDLARLDKVVLSHAHFDHTGGLLPLLENRKRETDIIAHPRVWDAKYGQRPSIGRREYVGIPFQRQLLETKGARFKLSAEPVWLSENIVVTGEIPFTNDYEHIDADLFVQEGDELLPDLVPDDQAIVVKTEAGLVVLLGCAHRGIINTVQYAQKLTGIDTVYAVMGGTHLLRTPATTLDIIMEAIKGFGLVRLGVSHCTGLSVAAYLSRELGDIMYFNMAGTRTTFPLT